MKAMKRRDVGTLSGLLCVLLGSFAAPAAVHAQWIVNDPAHQASNLAQFAKQLQQSVTEYEQMITAYKLQMQQFQQLLNTFSNLPSMLTNFAGNTLQPLSDADEAKLVTQNCGSGSGSLLQTALGFITPDSGSNIAQNQYTICVNLTQLQVSQYNDAVAHLNDVDSFAAQMKSIDTMRNQITEDDPNAAGKMEGVLEQTARTNQELATKTQQYAESYRAKEATIEALTKQQSILANVALKGKPTPAGQVVQAAAFAAAFSN